MRKLFTSESVTEGHPDKVCDSISDAVLDAALAVDPESRVACETAATTDFVLVMGEMTTKAALDIPAIVRNTIREIGYDRPELGFCADTAKVNILLDRQSPDIALGVDAAMEKKDGGKDTEDAIGAGDQGIMFGYASNETEVLMPAAIHYAHRLTKRLTQLRKSGELPFLRPDGKSQVTVAYEGSRPVRIDTVVLSAQHDDMDMEELRKALKAQVILPALPGNLIDEQTRFFINPTGRFVIGGPQGDSGLTGRKIIVDTYGGAARHGGGCFSGKDATKVDRSAAYMARYAAKNLVAAGLADRCEIQLSYAIGVARPVSVLVDTFGTGKADEAAIAQAVDRVFDFRPEAIREALDLKRPIFKKTAAYGHFGENTLDLPWEQADRVEELFAAL